MSDWLIALILGIVEGLTEFLPVSSTGHLILVNTFATFKDEDFARTFDMFIQVGAIFAVIIYFWNRLWIFDKSNFKINQTKLSIWLKTIVGVIPALILGYLFDDFITEYLFNARTVSISLIIGGIILLFIERQFQNHKIERVEEISYPKAFAIGFIQCLAMIPGVSRSASTIIGGLALGLSRVAAAEFSFFLAIPTLTAASCYFLIKHAIDFTGHQFMILGFGFLVAFIAAYLVISVFMRYIQRHNFVPFGYYRIALGCLILFYMYFNR